MTSLIQEEPLDGKEEIELELPREELFLLMMAAHERDITLNQLIEEILVAKLNEMEREALLVNSLQDLPPEV